jgi:hypothetical protein
VDHRLICGNIENVQDGRIPRKNPEKRVGSQA